MKFDNLFLEAGSKKSPEILREDLGFKGGDRILIAGSTHPGEEEILGRVFKTLLEKFSGLKLLLAPRHIERSARLAQDLRGNGLRVKLGTDGDSPSDWNVLILNQLGILREAYAVGEVVFMGGSLVPHGGQNPIEPASFERAVVHGPYVFNFSNIYQVLDQEAGALCVHNEAQLSRVLERLLEDGEDRNRLGEKAFQIVNRFRGATKHQLDWFLERMPHAEVPTGLFSPAY
jgi:3-deoxy-D-manno-octulosonic-acid transferase